MKNFQKFVTAQERAEAFEKFCENNSRDGFKNCCSFCKLDGCGHCESHWLNLEAEDEKPLLCPYCGLVPVSFIDDKTGKAWVACTCGYQSPEYKSESLAIAAHNRVAKAVRESEVK